MKITFIGTGSAFTVDDNYQSNILIESSSKKMLLIDCGADARHALHERGLSGANIDAVYVSHLHSDHIGGLEWLAFTTLLMHHHKLRLFIYKGLVEPLWENALKAGLSSLDGQAATLETYFDVFPIEHQFRWEEIDFKLVEVLHIIDNNVVKPCFGLFIQTGNNNIFITTDTRFTPMQLKQYYESADIIFHDCETSEKKSGPHAHFLDLKTLPEEIKQKMCLYSYNDGPLPDALENGFRGFVKKGQTFSFT